MAGYKTHHGERYFAVCLVVRLVTGVIMSPEDTASPGEGTNAWPVLTLIERRVLGVLVEKAKTTPDIYPLSLNALVTGCNQKSNRDPVLHLSDLDVEDALAS